MSITFLSSDATFSSDTFTSTNLTTTLESGKTYLIRATVGIDKAGNDPGGALQFGGTATMNAIQWDARLTFSFASVFQGPIDSHDHDDYRGASFPAVVPGILYPSILVFTATLTVNSGGTFVLQGIVDDPPTSFVVKRTSTLEVTQLD